jgi:hypothetical protein
MTGSLAGKRFFLRKLSGGAYQHQHQHQFHFMQRKIQHKIVAMSRL